MDVLPNASVCMCVLEGLQLPSVNLSCHVETSACHCSPVVLHGELTVQPLLRVLFAMLLLHRLELLQAFNVDSADERFMPQGIFFDSSFRQCFS